MHSWSCQCRAREKVFFAEKNISQTSHARFWKPSRWVNTSQLRTSGSKYAHNASHFGLSKQLTVKSGQRQVEPLGRKWTHWWDKVLWRRLKVSRALSLYRFEIPMGSAGSAFSTALPTLFPIMTHTLAWEWMLVYTSSEATWILTVDANSQHWHIPIPTKEPNRTKFKCHSGWYRFLHMPFDLINTPIIFQCTMDILLGELIGRTGFVYVDDVLVFSKPFDTFLQIVDTALSTLRKASVLFELNKKLKHAKDVSTNYSIQGMWVSSRHSRIVDFS